jgi:hypothetical protein
MRGKMGTVTIYFNLTGIGVPAFIVKGSGGPSCIQFQATGDVLALNGRVVPNASVAQRTPSASRPEFIVRTGPNNADVVALFPTDDNYLYIKGSVEEHVSGLSANPAKRELLIRGSDGSVQSLIDEDGNLKMRGTLFQSF